MLDAREPVGGVSIRAPVRGATSASTIQVILNPFRSAPPCGGRRPASPASGSIRCFDPRPRAGGDQRYRACQPFSPVSIRAPVRGATLRRRGLDAGQQVSIRAPVRGATLVATYASAAMEFRSAPPCGGRHIRPINRIPVIEVSIRAPVRGATTRTRSPDGALYVSIRAPVRGATSGSVTSNQGSAGFDPRPRAGGDDDERERARVSDVSIRAPVRGATSKRSMITPAK